MPTAKQNKEYRDRRYLNDVGWTVKKSDNVSMHTGNETLQHFMAKAVTAYRLREVGYRVDSEVTHESGNSVDVLGYGCKGRSPIGVEIETDLTSNTKHDKIDKYVHQGKLSDVFFLEATDVPDTFIDAYQWVKGQVI